VIASCALLAPVVAAQDVEGGKDHPLFNRMPVYRIQRYEEQDFDTHVFKTGAGTEAKVEGHLYRIRYSLKDGAKEPSQLEVLRNYEAAIKRIGGVVMASNVDGSSFLRVTKDGKEIWVEVSAYITSEWELIIVEKSVMAQVIVADAAAFASDIKTTGHVAVYGIYFDTGKAVVKPESDAAIAQIAKLLANTPGLKLHVVGHTDNVGAMDLNMKLSQARADAVVQVLVTKHGIAADRLRGAGVGPLAPVASNDAEAGRSKNRRVELVRQ